MIEKLKKIKKNVNEWRKRHRIIAYIAEVLWLWYKCAAIGFATGYFITSFIMKLRKK